MCRNDVFLVSFWGLKELFFDVNCPAMRVGKGGDGCYEAS